MEFFDAVAKRASYRGAFLPEEMPEEDIRKIITAGIQAPSGMNLQTTDFYIVRNPEIKAKIAERIPSEAVKSAPVIFVIATRIVEKNNMSFEVEDYAASTENILLAMTALGYAGVWMDGMTQKNEGNKEIHKMLGLSDEQYVRTIIPCGKPANEPKQADRLSFDERAKFVD